MVGVKQGHKSIALDKDVLVSVNMSTPNIEMGSRERPAALKKQDGDEREDVVGTSPKQMMDWENQRRRDSTSSPHIQQQYSFSIGSSHILS